MTRWRQSLVCGFVLVAIGAWVSGCNSRGDTQTNWLKACDSKDDCGDFVCECGVCTLECTGQSDCVGAPTGVACMASSSPAAQALCGANAPASVCLYECSRNAECAKGQRCEVHTCVSIGDDQGQAGSGGTGAEAGGASDDHGGADPGGGAKPTGDAGSGTTASDAGTTSTSIGGAGGTSSVEPAPAGAGGEPSAENAGGTSEQAGPGLVDRGGKSTALASDGVAVADVEACPGEVQGEWIAMTQTGAPTPAADPYLYWDGQELLVFYFSQVYGLYDPCQDAWRTVSTSPSYLSPTAAIEADARLWFFRSIYDPSTEGLSPELSGLNPASGAFEVRSVTEATTAEYTADVSTGTDLMVWGGAVARSTNDGYDGTNAGSVYSPADDRWRAMSQQGAPTPRIAPAAWTGTELAVWGGHSADTVLTDGGRSDCALSNAPQCVEYGDGALYDPALDSWRPMSKIGAPAARRDHIVAWTGNRVLVWGGRTIDTSQEPYTETLLVQGGLYDPVGETWTPTPALDMTADEMRNAAPLWTGERIVMFSNTGPRRVYEPSSNSLVPLELPDGTRSCNLPETQAGAAVTLCYSTNASTLDTIAVLPPGSMTWRTHPLPADVPTNPSLLWTGHRLFVWGGMVRDAYGCEEPPPPPITGCDPMPPEYGNAGWFMAL
jgi:hypothetical protein